MGVVMVCNEGSLDFRSQVMFSFAAGKVLCAMICVRNESVRFPLIIFFEPVGSKGSVHSDAVLFGFVFVMVLTRQSLLRDRC